MELGKSAHFLTITVISQTVCTCKVTGEDLPRSGEQNSPRQKLTWRHPHVQFHSFSHYLSPQNNNKMSRNLVFVISLWRHKKMCIVGASSLLPENSFVTINVPNSQHRAVFISRQHANLYLNTKKDVIIEAK